MFLIFFCCLFPPFLCFFAFHQYAAASLECSLMNYFISGPSSFIRNNASIFSYFNKLHRSLFLTFLKLKNLSAIFLEYGANKHNCSTTGHCSGVFIVNFEHISHLVLMFLLLTLNMLAGSYPMKTFTI